MQPSWMGSVPLWDEVREPKYSSPTWGYNEKLVTWNPKRVLTRIWPCWHYDHRLSASRTVRSKFLLIRQPEYGIFLLQLKLRQGLIVIAKSNDFYLICPHCLKKDETVATGENRWIGKYKHLGWLALSK